MKKKVLAMVLAVLLIISILPVSALAADTPETYYWAVLKYKGTDKKTAAEYPKLIISSDKISVGADFEYYTTGDADATEDQKAGHGTFLSTEVFNGYDIPWRLKFYPDIETASVTGNVRPVSTAHWFNCEEVAGTSNAITGIDCTGLDTSKVTDMSYMFFICESLTELDVSGFDTSKVTNMCAMFDDCASLTELNVSGFDTSKVTDMDWMFGNCNALTELDVSGWDTSNVTDMSCMFDGCTDLKKLALPEYDYPEEAFIGDAFDTVYTAGTKPIENAQGSIANIVLNGGEIDGFEDGYISVPTQSGKVFKGYFADSAFTAEIKPDTNGKYAEPQVQTTYYAKWEDIPGGGYASCKKDGTCPMSAYTDVKTGAWYHDGVHYCLENGFMNGVGKNTFAPNGTTSRAMIVTILYRLEGEPAFMNDSVFRDVASGSWYEKAVVWASGKGIVGGYGDGKFGPDDPVTREQLAAILYRYAQYKEQDVSVDENTNFLSFNDFFDISEYAKPAMMWAIYNGLIEGDNWDLTPQGSASRAQVAAILQRYCENTAK